MLISGLIFSQNFQYDSDDWHVITRPGSINAISEDNFNIYFATDNGIFIYDKIMEDFRYDHSFSLEFDFAQIRHMIYDNYRDYFWIVHSNGISYKSSVSSIWRDVSLFNTNIFSYYEIDDIGVSPDFFWIRSLNDLHPFDPFSASVEKWEDAQNDVDFINWGHSRYGIAGENLDISSYSIYGNWPIGLSNTTHRDGSSMIPTLSMKDEDRNQWFGTTEGYVLKGWHHSARLELVTIGLPFDHVTTAYFDQGGNWWFSDSYFKRTGRLSSFVGRNQTPFIAKWYEEDNEWTYYTPEESILIEHTDVNTIYRIGNTVYFGTMYGLLYLDLYNEDWNLIDETNGLNDSAIWDIIEYDGSIYVATANGINEISIVNHSLIPDVNDHFKPLMNFKIYDMEVDSEFIYMATDNGLYKMDWKRGDLSKLSKKEFHKISLEENTIAGTDGTLWFVNDENEEKYISSNVHDFDICGSYIWMSKGNKAALLDSTTYQEWKYDQLDGIPGQKIYGVNCDTDWVWFLTNKGIAFYNWKQYHYEKN